MSGVPVDDAEFVRAGDLRHAIQQVALALQASAKPAHEHVVVLNAFAASPPLARTLDPASLTLSIATPVSVDALLSEFARDALGLAADPQARSRVRQCESPDCGLLFFDDSRPASGAGARRAVAGTVQGPVPTAPVRQARANEVAYTTILFRMTPSTHTNPTIDVTVARPALLETSPATASSAAHPGRALRRQETPVRCSRPRPGTRASAGWRSSRSSSPSSIRRGSTPITTPRRRRSATRGRS